jgi:membrane protein
MSLEGLSGLVNRIIAWADRLQRKHGVLGFPYAVVKKYGDDGGGRQAALITYYGFLSIFPLLLLGVAVLSRVLADHPDLRQRLIDAIVPRALGSTVEQSLAALPTSAIPFIAGLIGLLLSATGVVFSAYQTLNHVAAVRYRLRAGFFSRYVRVLVVLATLLAGALATGALTVVATALPGEPGLQQAAAVLGSALVVFAVLLLGAKMLLARPAPVRALWPGAIIGAAAVTVVLNAGAPLLARLVAKAGPVYGSFATVAGIFALLYLVGQALVYAAEVAAVRYARLWPRALDVDRPTAADARALALLAREQERIPAARVEFHLATGGSPPVPGGSPPANVGPG